MLHGKFNFVFEVSGKKLLFIKDPSCKNKVSRSWIPAVMVERVNVDIATLPVFTGLPFHSNITSFQGRSQDFWRQKERYLEWSDKSASEAARRAADRATAGFRRLGGVPLRKFSVWWHCYKKSNSPSGCMLCLSVADPTYTFPGGFI